MNIDPLQPPPYQTAEIPGIGGRVKVEPEDFLVEEIPAYEPSGDGPFLFLWIEKRDMGAEYFTRQVARRLGLRPEDIGMAGLKDRRAVTRQWISLPDEVEPRLASLAGDGIQVLRVSKHTNKLRPGHLHGNRFQIRIRDIDPTTATTNLDRILGIIRQKGLANYYGPQRFGNDGATFATGMRLLRGEKLKGFRAGKFLRKLALSAVQSALFNHYLSQRMGDGLLHQVLPGDVMAKWPFGGMFVAEDVAAEQARFDAREIVSAGPMFGRKMFTSQGLCAEREAAILAAADLTAESFHGFGKLLQGTRRHNLIYVDALEGKVEGSDALVSFALPAGSYATILLREITKETILVAEESAVA